MRSAVAAALLVASCALNPSGLVLAPGWEAHSLAVWRHMRPDMIAWRPGSRWAYVTLENPASISSPSLGAFRPHARGRAILIYGLHRADGLRFAPDGSLWIGEEADQGLVWRVAEPDRLPAEQRVERAHLTVSDDSIAPFFPAGRFAHEGIAFSRDGRFAYLADEHPEGCLYRLNLRTHALRTLAGDGWARVRHPEDARAEAHRLGCRRFARIEDMETLPDGRIAMAETLRARVLVLDDRGAQPGVKVLLASLELGHPDNLAWDEGRRWLWITDDSTPSRLLAWTGAKVLEVARHPKAEITGVLVVGREVWIDLQRRDRGPDLTVALVEAPRRASR